ncbi:serine/threonine-protein kinase fray2-like [Gigantopelta aegis]|uniref:serine/threonine-protein kinase fray2-like n=1 Tax=Gigantopelta aegis TaxID=1735272 RepID=UPI001B88C6C7|nr:serine/threonine-protein kinase fray2-like [Gigantopelta aegis]
MHRSYQSVLPTANKLLQWRWDTTYYNEHRRKVHSAAPMVDTKAPPTYMHLHLKLKKLQLEEERLATIERDNRILLEKMSYIMRTRGRVDNRNNYEYKSLNREKRQRELLRVTRENQEILRRITMRQPEYSAKKWQEDWEENQKFMDSISHFPKDWWLDNDRNRRSQRSARSARREKSPGSKGDTQREKDEKKDSAKLAKESDSNKDKSAPAKKVDSSRESEDTKHDESTTKDSTRDTTKDTTRDTTKDTTNDSTRDTTRDDDTRDKSETESLEKETVKG